MKIVIIHEDVKVEYVDKNNDSGGYPALDVIRSLGELVMLIKEQRNETKEENG